MTSLSKMRFVGAVSVLALTAFAAQGEVLKETVGGAPNLEPAPRRAPAAGFALTVEGVTVAGDARLANPVRQADVRLERNDVSVTFDGFAVKPRLDAGVRLDAPLRPGVGAQFQSRLNYPAFVARGEIRLFSAGRLVATAPLAPNAMVTVALPEGEDLSYSYRVYDAQGRFDETTRAPIEAQSAAFAREEGTDRTALRGINVRGGAVTVHVRNLMTQMPVSALGGTVQAGASKSAVIQRILPVGKHDVVVNARGSAIIRPIEIPASDWFLTGVADLTAAHRIGDLEELGLEGDLLYGRVQGYAKGRTAGGWDITASVDTREDDLENLFKNITERDPRAILSRSDPDLYYPTYGDDSTLVDDTPTSSGLYVKFARAGSHAVIGDFKSEITGTELLRNERALYGAQGLYRSSVQTSRGEAKIAIEGYLAQPEHLPRRDQFRATGGSAYFLSEQDIELGSETVQIELRDPDTSRVIARQTLVYGTDYEMNYSQGLVMLKAPLASLVQGQGFMGAASPNGYYLAVQYEYTPLLGDVDGASTGARAQAWISDNLRLGVTASSEETGEAAQEAAGMDLRLALGQKSALQLETAQTDGPGFGTRFSQDGGLTLSEGGRVASGAGRATRLEAELDAQDLGLSGEGKLRLSYEDREAGFATIDRQTTEDETMGSVSLEMALGEKTGLLLSHEAASAAGGDEKTESRVEITRTLSQSTDLTLGLLALDRTDMDRADRTGRREDLGLRLAHRFSEDLEGYIFGLGSLAQEGGLARGDRAGIGGHWGLSKHWALAGEVSDGKEGAAADLRLGYEKGTSSAYLGYAMAAEASQSTSEDGTLVWGGQRKVSESVTLLTENSSDLFGAERSLTSTYGAEFVQNSRLTHDLRTTFGTVSAREGADITRQAVSIGSRYETGEGFAARGRIELRSDETDAAPEAETSVLFTGNMRYDFDGSRRLISKLDLLRSNDSAEQSRDYTDFELGYALRPIVHDDWSMLVKYQYFYDLYGQKVEGSESRGPRQRSHIASLEGRRRVSDHWSLGAKIGLRASETQQGEGLWSENNAWLAVANARYHLPNKWDLLVEARHLQLSTAQTGETGFLAAAYKQFGDHISLGAGYNFTSFSDDLTDIVQDSQGPFINLVMKY